MVELECEHCGSRFTAHAYRSDSARYCSRACWNAARAQAAYERVCAGCGGTFLNTREQRNRRYCSEACLRAARRKYDHDDKVCAHCGNLFPYSAQAPHQRFCGHGCAVRSRAYPCDERFFASIESEGQAYVLGLMYSDGCIYTTNGKKYLNFASKDRDQVETVRALLKSEHPLHNSGSGALSLIIGNATLYDDLERWGVSERKSWKEYPLPPLSDELYRHFVRGFFDGDGSVYHSKVQGGRYMYLGMSFHGGSFTFLSERRSLLIGQGIAAQRLHADKNNWRLTVGTQGAVAWLARWMYHDATYRLQRKYDVVLRFYNGQLPDAG